jgi:glycyl-tRNA synthetase beta subunit
MNKGQLCFVLQIESQPITAQLRIEQTWPAAFGAITNKFELVPADVYVRATTCCIWLQATLPTTTPLVKTTGPATDSEHAAQFRARFSTTELLETPSGVRLVGITPPRPTETLLSELLNTLLAKTNLPYAMHQGGWIRPVRAAACAWQSTPLQLRLERLNLTTTTQIQSHPLRTPQNILTLRPPPPLQIPLLDIKPQYTSLLDENIRTVHNYDHIVCTIPSKFQYLPTEFLETALVQHQKLIPAIQTHQYIAIIEAGTCRQTVAANLSRVITARLQDIEFFYQQDKKKTIDEHSARLNGRPFFEGLGTYLDKRTRIQKAIERFSRDPDATLVSNYLYFDLLTAIVEEFPELEGIAAETYADNPNIGQILRTAIWPRNETDPKPPSITTSALWISWIKHLDTLVGFSLLDKLPSGSRDPLALRRTGNCFVQAGLQLMPDTDWMTIAEFLAKSYPGTHCTTTLESLQTFVHQRMLYCLREFPHAKALLAANTNPWTALQRAQLKLDVPQIEQTYKRLRRLIADYPPQAPITVKHDSDWPSRGHALTKLCDWSNATLDKVHIQSSPDALDYIARFTGIIEALSTYARW